MIAPGKISQNIFVRKKNEFNCNCEEKYCISKHMLAFGTVLFKTGKELYFRI